MSIRPAALAVAAIALLVLAGCATRSTTLDAHWVNPEFAGRQSIRSVMVVAAVRDLTTRRMFEDRMDGALSSAGVKAVQFYRFIPGEGPASEEQLRRAVADAGVGHALVSRIVNVTTDVHVTPGMVMGPAWGPGWGWPGTGWGHNRRLFCRVRHGWYVLNPALDIEVKRAWMDLGELMALPLLLRSLGARVEGEAFADWTERTRRAVGRLFEGADEATPGPLAPVAETPR